MWLVHEPTFLVLPHYSVTRYITWIFRVTTGLDVRIGVCIGMMEGRGEDDDGGLERRNGDAGRVAVSSFFSHPHSSYVAQRLAWWPARTSPPQALGSCRQIWTSPRSMKVGDRWLMLSTDTVSSLGCLQRSYWRERICGGGNWPTVEYNLRQRRPWRQEF